MFSFSWLLDFFSFFFLSDFSWTEEEEEDFVSTVVVSTYDEVSVVSVL